MTASFGLGEMAIGRASFQKADGVIPIWPHGKMEAEAGKYLGNDTLHSSSVLQRVSEERIV